MPRYKARQKEALAWLFVASIKIDLEPLKLSITHTNRGFLKRFHQLIRLGFVKTQDLNRDIWQVTNTQEIIFFLNSIKPHIHTQRESKIVNLLIQHFEAPSEETKEALEPLLKKHNILFFVLDEYFS